MQSTQRNSEWIPKAFCSVWLFSRFTELGFYRKGLFSHSCLSLIFKQISKQIWDDYYWLKSVDYSYGVTYIWKTRAKIIMSWSAQNVLSNIFNKLNSNYLLQMFEPSFTGKAARSSHHPPISLSSNGCKALNDEKTRRPTCESCAQTVLSLPNCCRYTS